MKKKKEKKEIDNDNIELIRKKRKKRIIIILLLLIVVAIIVYIFPFFLITKKDKHLNNHNITYLNDKYGDNLKINFIVKRKKWKYKICSKETNFCANAFYDKKNNDWEYPNGEGFVYTVIFMDEIVGILDNDNIEYKTYTNNENTLTDPDKFILIIKKNDNYSSLVSAIKEINRSKTINLLCTNSDNKCNGQFEINIFNEKDYDLITNTLTKEYNVKGYEDFYKVLYDSDEFKFGKRLGQNIIRHNIDDGMFNCSDNECNSYKHLVYRYVIGNHNHVGNTIVIEGITKK